MNFQIVHLWIAACVIPDAGFRTLPIRALISKADLAANPVRGRSVQAALREIVQIRANSGFTGLSM